MKSEARTLSLVVPETIGWKDRSDDDLMRLVRAADTRAFEVLVRRYAGPLVGYLAKSTRDLARAQELAQEVWISLWSNRESYMAGTSFRSWLFGAAVNRVRNEKRDRFRRGKVFSREENSEDRAKDSTPQIDKLIQREKLEELVVGIEGLSSDHREALLLRFSAGLDYSDIAQAVGANESTVRSRVFFGIAKLREKVGATWAA